MTLLLLLLGVVKEAGLLSIHGHLVSPLGLPLVLLDLLHGPAIVLLGVDHVVDLLVQTGRIGLRVPIVLVESSHLLLGASWIRLALSAGLWVAELVDLHALLVLISLLLSMALRIHLGPLVGEREGVLDLALWIGFGFRLLLLMLEGILLVRVHVVGWRPPPGVELAHWCSLGCLGLVEQYFLALLVL